MENQIKCIDEYGKECLKGFTKQSLGIGINGFKKLHKSICSGNFFFWLKIVMFILY